MSIKKALLILNTEINLDIEKYWYDPEVVVKICADGGANRLYTYNKTKKLKEFINNYIFALSLIFLIASFFCYQLSFMVISLSLLLLNARDNRIRFPRLVPDFIIGDMDSYKGFTVNVIKIDDQDTTDFTKCVTYLEKKYNPDEIIVIGGYGGRRDHEVANYETVAVSKTKIVMIDKDNYMCKIYPGDNNFEVNGYCGLIPLTKSKIITEGFKWNVNSEMEFGRLISTSNYAVGKVNVKLEPHNHIHSCEILNATDHGLCLFWKSNTAT